MSCFKLCNFANDGICMGLCAAGLSPSGFSFEKQQDERVLVTHRSMPSRVIALVSLDDAESIKETLAIKS